MDADVPPVNVVPVNPPAVVVVVKYVIPPLPTARDEPPVILVVDGELATRAGNARDFELHGCTAIPACSVAEAITCLSRPWLGIDVILLDLDLPDGPGEVVLAVLRNTPRLSHVRAVAHVGGGERGRVAGLAGYGVTSWVEKPGEFRAMWNACLAVE